MNDLEKKAKGISNLDELRKAYINEVGPEN